MEHPYALGCQNSCASFILNQIYPQTPININFIKAPSFREGQRTLLLKRAYINKNVCASVSSISSTPQSLQG